MNASNGPVRQLAKGLAFLSPWLVGFVTFTLVPVALAIYYSCCRFDLLQPPRFVGFRNYIELAHDEVFWLALKNTGYFMLLSLPAGLIVSVGIAMLLNAKIPGQVLWRTLIFMPSLVPGTAAAMLWMWILNARLGLVNYLLGFLGISSLPWLASVRWAMPALAVMSIWSVGNAVVIYLAGLQDVPAELYEAAELDGAGVLGRMLNVTLPMLSPVIFFNLIMAVIGALQTFDIPYIMTAGGPAHATYLLSMYLYDNAFIYLQMGYASAIGLIMLVLVLALTALAFWSSSRWVHYQK